MKSEVHLFLKDSNSFTYCSKCGPKGWIIFLFFFFFFFFKYVASFYWYTSLRRITSLIHLGGPNNFSKGLALVIQHTEVDTMWTLDKNQTRLYLIGSSACTEALELTSVHRWMTPPTRLENNHELFDEWVS